MDRIIITGATGFVGINITDYLKSKALYLVEGLSLRKPVGYLLKARAVIHLAGKAHDLKNAGDPGEYFDINTTLTKKLFELFLKSEVSDFIYFSSVKAVADEVEGILQEDVIPDPQTAYGKSKQQAEAYLMNQVIPEGKRVFILRPCMIHGPGNKGNLNLLYKLVKKGIPYPLAAFSNLRSFLSISNLNYIIERLISDPSIPGGIYNVADDIPLSTNEVINIIATAGGYKTKLWKIRPPLIKSLAGMGDLLRLPLNSERLKKLTESYVVSNEKIRKALGIEALPTSSRDGLVTTIKSFAQN